MPVKPYNPLDKNSIGENIVKKLVSQPAVPLPDPTVKGLFSSFEGAGIYAIYYFGDLDAYNGLFPVNQAEACETPIYIGKADPKGGRKGGLNFDAGSGTSLYVRLRDHAESIHQATNLNLADFRCRYLVVDEVWIGLGERTAIQTYLPLWNTRLDGFGNHDPGNRRATQYRSDWDNLHPGRTWAQKLAESPKSVNQIITEIRLPITHEQLELLALESLDAES
jgi:hypothetical protein